MWASLCHEPHFEQYMPFSRWKDFRCFPPKVFAEEGKKLQLMVLIFVITVDEFNDIHKSELHGTSWISIDETICDMCMETLEDSSR